MSTDEIRAFLRLIGAKGGRARWARMTPEQRIAAQRKAGSAPKKPRTKPTPG
jgi:hypothetical protein